MMPPRHLELILLCSRTIHVQYLCDRETRTPCSLQTSTRTHCSEFVVKGKLRRSRAPDDVLQLNGQDIPFVNNVTYLGVTFDRRMTCRHHIERIVAKAVRTYISTYSLSKSGRLNINIKVTLYKTLIRSVVAYVCPTWEYALGAHFFRSQRLHNRVHRAIGNPKRCSPVRELHVTYIYEYITKSFRSQAEVILNM
jgi:hypothetical protein